MPEFWLDADVLIQAKNHHYAFDIAPGFWAGLGAACELGVLRSPMRVYDELANGKDELADWAKKARATGFFVEGGKTVQDLLSPA